MLCIFLTGGAYAPYATCNTLHNTIATQLNEYMRNFCKGLVITFKWVSRVTESKNSYR